MNYTIEKTEIRHCPTCKRKTEFLKSVDLCLECFMSNTKQKKPKPGELF